VPVAMVWPCPLSVDAYVEAGRGVEVPRPDCPRCGAAMWFWSGYRRWVREAGSCLRIFVPRVRCARCRRTDALLPAFLLAGRLDVTDSVGRVIEAVASGAVGVRPAATRAGVPYTTAREWRRRFTARAGEIGVAFAALCVELGGPVLGPVADAGRRAVTAIEGAFAAACEFPGWAGLTRWRFASAVSGGSLLAANTDSPYLVVGKRRFLPPIPENRVETGGEHGP
jgi:transposase-like protein